jgi:hypothetical protein
MLEMLFAQNLVVLAYEAFAQFATQEMKAILTALEFACD